MIITAFIILCLWHVGFSETTDLEVTIDFMFPYQANKSLAIILRPKDQNFDIHDFVNHTIAVSIVAENGTVLDVCQVQIDNRYMADVIYESEYMSVIDWTKSLTGNMLRIHIAFMDKAHDCNVTVDQIGDVDKPRNLLNTKIHIKMLSDIKMTLQSVNIAANEILLNDSGLITCRGYGRPEFLYLNENLSIIKSIKKSTGKIVVHFKAAADDHMKRVWCQVGHAKRYLTIKVLHPPTKLSIKPEACQNFSPGQNITCEAVDGYPTPTVKWKFISGSADVQKHFEIKDSIFKLKKSIAKCSKLEIMCISLNVIDGKAQFYNRTITVAVQDNPAEVYLEKFTLLSEKINNLERSQVFSKEEKNKLLKKLEALEKEQTLYKIGNHAILQTTESSGKIQELSKKERTQFKNRIETLEMNQEEHKTQINQLQQLLSVFQKNQEAIFKNTVLAKYEEKFTWTIENFLQLCQKKSEVSSQFRTKCGQLFTLKMKMNNRRAMSVRIEIDRKPSKIYKKNWFKRLSYAVKVVNQGNVSIFRTWTDVVKRKWKYRFYNETYTIEDFPSMSDIIAESGVIKNNSLQILFGVSFVDD